MTEYLKKQSVNHGSIKLGEVASISQALMMMLGWKRELELELKYYFS